MGELKSAACRPACAPTMAFPSPRPTLCSTSPSSRWLRLGITIERIQPGHPQQNGRHERMHLTLKTETTRPAGLNSLQQQTKFDDFLEEFNHERPHQALDMNHLAEFSFCTPSGPPSTYAFKLTRS